MSERFLDGLALGTILFKAMRKVVCLFLILLVIFSCSKNEDPETNCSANDWEFQYIDSNLKEFFFKRGSYWIFQNDSTKLFDSLFITNTESGCEAVYLYQGNGNNFEYYQISYSSYPSGYAYYDMIEFTLMQRNRHPSTYVSIHGWNLYSTWIDTSNQFLPKAIDSMTINGRTFSQVQLSYDLFHTSARVDTYTAKGVGIIKKVIYSGNYRGEWNLLRYKIIK